MLNKIVDVKVLAPHVLHVNYRDGFSAVHDFARFKNERDNLVAPLADPDYFARVFLEHGALTWPNGYDMCPDWLRMEIERDGALMGPVAAEEILTAVSPIFPDFPTASIRIYHEPQSLIDSPWRAVLTLR